MAAQRYGAIRFRLAMLAWGMAILVVALPVMAQAEPPASSSSASPTARQGTERVPAKQGARGATAQARAQRRAFPGNLVGHGGPVKAVAADPASGRALTGSFDYAMILWDTSGESARIVHRFAEHEGAVNAVAFVPGTSRALAAGDDGSVWLWDLQTGKAVHRFRGHEGKINGLAVSPDGRFAVSAGWDRTARLWDLQSLKAGPVLAAHKGPVNAAAFSSDGSAVYTASYDGTIAAWSAADGSPRQAALVKHGWGINVLVRLPGSELLLYGALNGSAAICDPASGKIVRELPASTRPILSAAAIDKPGLIAIGSGEGRILVLRAPDGAVIEEYQDPSGPVWALAFTDHGAAMYYGGLDDFVVRWQISPRAPFEPVQSALPRRFHPGDTASQGERQFARKCSVCHTLEADGRNRAGPTLHGLFGRKAGSVAGYPYSPALKDSAIVWNEDTVSKLFEQGPDTFTPGSKMPLQRITDRTIRDQLIAFLKQATAEQAPVRQQEPASK